VALCWEVADEDDNGLIDRHEFRCAYLTDTWQKARMFGATKKGILKLKREQTLMYRNWKKVKNQFGLGEAGGAREANPNPNANPKPKPNRWNN